MTPDLNRALKNAVHLAKRLLSDLPVFLRHKLRGSSYTEFYAERMDRRLRKDRSWGLNSDKKFQLDYLKKHGLIPQHRMLDYGCGAINSGIHFIGYLNPENYTGVDISQLAVEEGKNRVLKFSLSDKMPKILWLANGELNKLGENTFDFLWAQSVLTHMPPEDIERLFFQIQKHMRKTSVFFATFCRAESGFGAESFSDWCYSTEKFISMAAKSSLIVEIMADWRHPDDPSGRDTMAKITLGSSRL